MQLGIRDLSLVYGSAKQTLPVLDRLTLEVADGEFLAVLGPSGCGKSTLLRILAGFLEPTAGSVRAGGKELRGPGADRAMLMQQNALFPWLTVLENIAYPLRVQGRSRDRASQVARDWLNKVALEEFAEYLPHRLSIGMQQRVAVARLFAGDAGVLLMDEPFGALDPITRVHVQRLLMQIWGAERRTVVFVTHDVEEALLLADRIVVLGAKPARLIEQYPVSWPRPRQFEQIFTKEFVAARRDLLGLLGAQ